MLLPTPHGCVSSTTVCVSSGGCVSSDNVNWVPITAGHASELDNMLPLVAVFRRPVLIPRTMVGNYIHNMASFFSGLVIGFLNCWKIALITLATGPSIVAERGISNIFLHRLAENIQDAYAEAASIAEKIPVNVKPMLIS
ncbi:ABC transporter B family member 6 [Camellia lanceoleosa]|uniref:ABC transporter B family member 6 n=1 Tax=Camellia lanceoleosa TaxID=1840588 RepID=A0ACC0GJJ7_9ERIC|nr:ABC transporter B family member 6 [Camellia lanceoleosa]